MKSVEELSLAGGLHAAASVCRSEASGSTITSAPAGRLPSLAALRGLQKLFDAVLLVVLVVSRAAVTFSLDGETRSPRNPQLCLDSNEERSPLYSSSEHLRWSPGQFSAYFSFILGLPTAYTGETAS